VRLGSSASTLHLFLLAQQATAVTEHPITIIVHQPTAAR
jgi:hypothetical protein